MITLSRNAELLQLKQPLRLTKDSNEQDLKSRNPGREVKSVDDGRPRVETIFARFFLALGESAISGEIAHAPLSGATMPVSGGVVVKSRWDLDAPCTS